MRKIENGGDGIQMWNWCVTDTLEEGKKWFKEVMKREGTNSDFEELPVGNHLGGNYAFRYYLNTFDLGLRYHGTYFLPPN